MRRENPTLQDRRSILKTATKAVGGLTAGTAVVGTASADYCNVVAEEDMSSGDLICYKSSDLDTQYATVTVDTDDSWEPSGDIYGIYKEDCPTDTNYDQYENIDNDPDSMRIENWEADPGYGFTVTVDAPAHVTIKECG